MIPRLIDIHCHLDFPDFDKDREDVIKRTLGEGLGIINVGADFKSSQKSVELSEKYGMIWAATGAHPHDVEEDFDIDKYRELAGHPKVVAIGECGLDISRIKSGELRVRNKQTEIFNKQIELALELNKPLMIHCRGAHEEVLRILGEYKKNSELRGNIHFFSGNWEQARKYLDLGFMLSFTGVITFARDYDEVIKKVPIDKIMVETDAPFVAPVPWRGKRCEPIFVKETAQKVAEIKGLSFEEVAGQTTKNAIKLFGLA